MQAKISPKGIVNREIPLLNDIKTIKSFLLFSKIELFGKKSE